MVSIIFYLSLQIMHNVFISSFSASPVISSPIIVSGPVDQSTPIARKRLRTEQAEEEL